MTANHKRNAALCLGLVLGCLVSHLRAEAPGGSLPEAAFLVPAGSPVTLAPAVTGTPPLTYQWLKNGTVIRQANGAALEVASARATDAGTYGLRVTNAEGVWTSPPIRVGVYKVVTQTLIRRAGRPLTLQAEAWGPGVRVYWENQFQDFDHPNPVMRLDKMAQGEMDYQAYAKMEGLGAPDSLGAVAASYRIKGVGLPLAPMVAMAIRANVGEPLNDSSLANGELGLTYHARGLPPGITIEGDSLVGTPTKAGSYIVTAWTSDGYGKSPAVQQLILVGTDGIGLRGEFTGVALPAQTPDGLGSVVKVNLNLNGSFTGQMQLGARSVSFAGVMEPAGQAYEARLPIPTLTGWYLNLMATSNGTYLYGNIKNSTDPVLDGEYFDMPPPATVRGGVDRDPRGRHVFSLETHLGFEDSDVTGFGFGSVNVAHNLTANAVGTLPDGTVFTVGGRLLEGNTGAILATRVLMNGRRDALVGWVPVIGASSTEMVNSGFIWVKAARPGARIAPAGFERMVNVYSSPYQPPRPGQLMWGQAGDPGDNARIYLSGGGLEVAAQGADLAEVPFRLTPQHRAHFSPPNATGLKLYISAATGLFSGQFTLTDPKPGAPEGQVVTRKVTFQGALLQRGFAGYGFFLMPELPDPDVPGSTLSNSPLRSGAVQLAPN